MTTRRKILAGRVLLIFAVIGVIGGLSWELLRTRIPNPIYQGRTLSYWFGRKITPDKAEEAVRYAGTNAIPILLHMMRAKDSPLERRWIGFTYKHGLFWCSFVPAETRYQQAFEGFKTLGSVASNAVPELMQIFESNVSQDSQLWVILSIEGVADDKVTVPFLLCARTNANNIARLFAVTRLARMRGHTDLVVPALISSLDDPAEYIRAFAIEGLEDLGPQARAAVPRLLKLYKNAPPDDEGNMESLHTRSLIDGALKKIDPAAAAANQIPTADPAQ